MILVDTSLWIDHLRHGHPELIRLLEEGQVAMHPMILGELACGQLPKRPQTLHLLGNLPRLTPAPDAAVLHALETHRWFGAGIGWVDAHLLTSALLAQTPLWTNDSRLQRIARGVGMAHG